MRRILGAAIVGMGVAWVMTGAALAAPGQCEVTGYESFDCDVVLDGDGLTFALPDGQVFAFTLTEENAGTAYLIEADARPGQMPDALGQFEAVEGRPGCWARDEDYQFCVLVEQQ